MSSKPIIPPKKSYYDLEIISISNPSSATLVASLAFGPTLLDFKIIQAGQSYKASFDIDETDSFDNISVHLLFSMFVNSQYVSFPGDMTVDHIKYYPQQRYLYDRATEAILASEFFVLNDENYVFQGIYGAFTITVNFTLKMSCDIERGFRDETLLIRDKLIDQMKEYALSTDSLKDIQVYTTNVILFEELYRSSLTGNPYGEITPKDQANLDIYKANINFPVGNSYTSVPKSKYEEIIKATLGDSLDISQLVPDQPTSIIPQLTYNEATAHYIKAGLDQIIDPIVPFTPASYLDHLTDYIRRSAVQTTVPDALSVALSAVQALLGLDKAQLTYSNGMILAPKYQLKSTPLTSGLSLYVTSQNLMMLAAAANPAALALEIAKTYASVTLLKTIAHPYYLKQIGAYLTHAPYSDEFSRYQNAVVDKLKFIIEPMAQIIVSLGVSNFIAKRLVPPNHMMQQQYMNALVPYVDGRSAVQPLFNQFSDQIKGFVKLMPFTKQNELSLKELFKQVQKRSTQIMYRPLSYQDRIRLGVEQIGRQADNVMNYMAQLQQHAPEQIVQRQFQPQLPFYGENPVEIVREVNNNALRMQRLEELKRNQLLDYQEYLVQNQNQGLFDNQDLPANQIDDVIIDRYEDNLAAQVEVPMDENERLAYNNMIRQRRQAQIDEQGLDFFIQQPTSDPMTYLKYAAGLGVTAGAAYYLSQQFGSNQNLTQNNKTDIPQIITPYNTTEQTSQNVLNYLIPATIGKSFIDAVYNYSPLSNFFKEKPKVESQYLFSDFDKHHFRPLLDKLPINRVQANTLIWNQNSRKRRREFIEQEEERILEQAYSKALTSLKRQKRNNGLIYY